MKNYPKIMKTHKHTSMPGRAQAKHTHTNTQVHTRTYTQHLQACTHSAGTHTHTRAHPQIGWGCARMAEVPPHTFLRQGPQLQHDTHPSPQVPLQGGHTHCALSTAARQSSPCLFLKQFALQTHTHIRACRVGMHASMGPGRAPPFEAVRTADACAQQSMFAACIGPGCARAFPDRAPALEAVGHLRWEVECPPSQPANLGFKPRRGLYPKLPCFGRYSFVT